MIKILIADDEFVERDGIIFLINKFSFELDIKECSDGEEALNYIKENTVDILFTDVKMPFLEEDRGREARSPWCCRWAGNDVRHSADVANISNGDNAMPVSLSIRRDGHHIFLRIFRGYIADYSPRRR